MLPALFLSLCVFSSSAARAGWKWRLCVLPNIRKNGFAENARSPFHQLLALAKHTAGSGLERAQVPGLGRDMEPEK